MKLVEVAKRFYQYRDHFEVKYVKDSQHALQIFRDFNFLGKGKLIFTMDITSLYTLNYFKMIPILVESFHNLH